MRAHPHTQAPSDPAASDFLTPEDARQIALSEPRRFRLAAAGKPVLRYGRETMRVVVPCLTPDVVKNKGDLLQRLLDFSLYDEIRFVASWPGAYTASLADKMIASALKRCDTEMVAFLLDLKDEKLGIPPDGPDLRI